jgi:hypothetical protein
MVEVRMDDAVYAIQKIPDRVDALVQHAMANLIQDVQQNVEAACNIVREDLEKSEGSDHTLQEAIENLEVIPEMVRVTFDNRKQEIKQTVNKKINNVIDDIERNRDPERNRDSSNKSRKSGSKKEPDPLQVLIKLQRLPEEVKEKMTKIQDAAEGARSAALNQLDYAVMHQLSTRQQYNLKQEMLQTIPEEWPQTIACAEAIAGQQVEQAMAQIMDAKQNIPNQAVADAILKAKLKSSHLGEHESSVISDGHQTVGPSSTLMGASEVSDIMDCQSTQSSTNYSKSNCMVEEMVCSPCIRRAFSDSDLVPNLQCSVGSRGHPELCARPCIHFWKGDCASGKDCRFCHRPHLRRPPRFDKRRREELKRLSLGELKEMLLPILQKKARYLGLETEVADALDTVRNFPDDHQASSRQEKQTHQHRRRIQGILEAMTLSTVLKTVQKLLLDSTSTCSQHHGQSVMVEFNKLLGLIEQFRGIAPPPGVGVRKYKLKDPYGIFLH